MNINRSTALLLCLGAIAFGAAVVLVPPLFQPGATQFSFYLYVENSGNEYTFSASPLFELDGNPGRPVEITVHSGTKELGTLVYDIMPKSVIKFTTHSEIEFEITDVEVTVDGVKWACEMDQDRVGLDLHRGLSPLYHCTTTDKN